MVTPGGRDLLLRSCAKQSSLECENDSEYADQREPGFRFFNERITDQRSQLEIDLRFGVLRWFFVRPA